MIASDQKWGALFVIEEGVPETHPSEIGGHVMRNPLRRHGTVGEDTEGDARSHRGADFAIGGLPFLEIAGAIRRAWAAETSFDPVGWTPKNPAWGQCASTAVVIYSIYGGDVLRSVATLPGGEGIAHYFNRLPDGTILDLTYGQFPTGTRFSAAHKRRPHGIAATGRASMILSHMLEEWHHVDVSLKELAVRERVTRQILSLHYGRWD